MYGLIVRRLLSIIPIVLGVTLLGLILINMTQGDFLSQKALDREVTEEFIQAQREQFGLDKPLIHQYAIWLGNLFPVKISEGEESLWERTDFRMNLGYSFMYRMDAWDIITSRLWATILLSLAALLVCWVIAIPLGILAAIYKDSWFDRISSMLAYVSLSVPDFFLALLALYFAFATGWFPVGGGTSVDYEFMSASEQFWDRLHHLILPALILGTGGIAGLMRIMRANFLEVIRSEFANTARAKGLSEFTVMVKHVLRNAINPLVSMLGFAFSGLFSGALIVEIVMGYPGLGRLMYDALMAQDQFVVLGSLLFGCVTLIIGNLLSDLGLGLVDPRIRVHE